MRSKKTRTNGGRLRLISWRKHSAIAASEIDRYREELIEDPFMVLRPGAKKNAANRRRCVQRIEHEFKQAKAREGDSGMPLSNGIKLTARMSGKRKSLSVESKAKLPERS